MSTASRSGEHTGAAAHARPMTGAEYLESIDDGREIFIYGERVAKTSTHPAFRNTARMLSATKYIGGHSDVVAGVLSGNKEKMEKIFNSEYMTVGSGIPF